MCAFASLAPSIEYPTTTTASSSKQREMQCRKAQHWKSRELFGKKRAIAAYKLPPVVALKTFSQVLWPEFRTTAATAAIATEAAAATAVWMIALSVLFDIWIGAAKWERNGKQKCILYYYDWICMCESECECVCRVRKIKNKN